MGLLMLLPFAGAALGASIFWLVKKLARLANRRHPATHIVARLIASLLALFASLVAVFQVIDLLSAETDAVLYILLPGCLLAGVPALAFGAGLGQRTRRAELRAKPMDWHFWRFAGVAILLPVLLFGLTRDPWEVRMWSLAIGCSAVSGVIAGGTASAVLNATRATRPVGLRVVVAIASAILAAVFGNYCGTHAVRYVSYDHLGKGVEGPFCASVALVEGLIFGTGFGQRTRRD